MDIMFRENIQVATFQAPVRGSWVGIWKWGEEGKLRKGSFSSSPEVAGPRTCVLLGITPVFLSEEDKLKSGPQRSKERTGEMARQLRILLALAEDPSVMPSTHIVPHNHL